MSLPSSGSLLRFTLVVIGFATMAPLASGRAPVTVLGDAEVVVAGGHDTNVFLPVVSQASLTDPSAGGWLARIAPHLGGSLVMGGWRLETSYDLDLRRVEQAGDLVHHRFEAAVSTYRLGPFEPRIAVSVGRFDTLRYPNERFDFLGGELDIRLELTSALWLGAAYHGQLRRFPGAAAPGSPWPGRLHSGELRLVLEPNARMTLGLAGSYASLDGLAEGGAEGAVRLARGGTEADVTWGRLALGGGLWAGALWLPSAQAQLGATVALRLRLADQLDVLVMGEWAVAPYGDAMARSYDRRFAGIGLRGRMGVRRALAELGGSDLRPVVRGSRVRLRVQAGHAVEVEVIGSWDGWAEGRPLRPGAEPGIWEAWLELPAGTHRYQFRVDGRAVPAPSASRYAADGFGGRDAVLDVPAGGDG